MLDQRRDQRTDRRFRSLLVSCHPGSSLQAAAGPVGSTSAVAAVRTVLQGVRTGLGVARSQGLAGMGWASRSSRCCWADPAGMAAYSAGMDQHLGVLVAATEGTAAVRPASEVSELFSELLSL